MIKKKINELKTKEKRLLKFIVELLMESAILNHPNAQLISYQKKLFKFVVYFVDDNGTGFKTIDIVPTDLILLIPYKKYKA